MLIKLPQKNNTKGIMRGGSNNNIKWQTVQTMHQASLFSGLALTSFAEEDELVDVVASEKGEDNRHKKKALLLSPYLSQFGNTDDGIFAKKILEKNKNYKGRVDFVSSNLSLDLYQSLGDYDLVHIVTHGERFCGSEMFVDGSEIEVTYGGDSNYCRTLLDTGIKHGFNNETEVQNFLAENPEYKNLIVIASDVIELKSSFFRHFYQNGIENKIWIFSACELGQQSDMRSTMNDIHLNGHFLYWSNKVRSSDASRAFNKFYRNLIKEGLDVKRAFEKIPNNLKMNLEYKSDNSTNVTTSLVHLKTGKSRHGIEVIEMKHPEKKNKTIKRGDFYPLVGDFGDGQPEALTLKVELRGYTRAEFEDKQMKVGLKVDDEIVLWNKPFLPDDETN